MQLCYFILYNLILFGMKKTSSRNMIRMRWGVDCGLWMHSQHHLFLSKLTTRVEHAWMEKTQSLNFMINELLLILQKSLMMDSRNCIDWNLIILYSFIWKKEWRIRETVPNGLINVLSRSSLTLITCDVFFSAVILKYYQLSPLTLGLWSRATLKGSWKTNMHDSNACSKHTALEPKHMGTRASKNVARTCCFRLRMLAGKCLRQGF